MLARLHRLVPSLVCLALVGVASAALAQDAVPGLTIEPSVGDVGVLASGEKKTVDFLIRNTSRTTLKLKSAVRVGCGCTTPRLTGTTLEPGGFVALSLTLDTKGMQGAFRKSSFLTLDDGTNREIEVLLQGKAIPAFVQDGVLVVRRDLADTSPVVASCTVRTKRVNAEGKDVRIADISPTSEALSLTWTEVARTSDDITYRVDAMYEPAKDKDAQPGTRIISAPVQLEGIAMGGATLPIMLELTDGIHASPSALRIVSKDVADTTITRTVRLRPVANRRVEFLGAVGTDRLVATLSPSDDGGATLTVQVPMGSTAHDPKQLTSGLVRVRALVDGQEKTLSIPVVLY